jgi:hypothetical protein
MSKELGLGAWGLGLCVDEQAWRHGQQVIGRFGMLQYVINSC